MSGWHGAQLSFVAAGIRAIAGVSLVQPRKAPGRVARRPRVSPVRMDLLPDLAWRLATRVNSSRKI